MGLTAAPDSRRAGERFGAPPPFVRAAVRAAWEAAVLWRAEMRRSAVFATAQVRELLAEYEQPNPAHAPISAIDAARWALSSGRDSDELAADLQQQDPESWREGTPGGGFMAVICDHAARLREVFAVPATEEEATRSDNGAFWLDEHFARYLEGLGEAGRKTAAIVRERARERWQRYQHARREGVPENGRLLALWLDLEAGTEANDFPFLRPLALSLWRDVVRPELETRQRYAPAIGTVQLDYLSHAAFEPGRSLEPAADGRSAQILDATGREVGRLAGVTPGLLGNIGAHRVSADFLRVFGGLVTEGHRQKATEPDNPRPERLVIPGGWGGLCELVRVPNQTRARRAFLLGRVLELQVPSGEILGLWKGDLFRERVFANRRACLVVDLSPRLLPPRRGEQLVPLIPPDREPALPADRKLTAPALLLVQYLLQHFRVFAESLALDGAVPVSREDWTLMARRADVANLDAVRGPLLHGTDDRPPLLVVVERDRFDLAEPYADVRRFLVAGGAVTKRNRARGRAAQRKRSAKPRRR